MGATLASNGDRFMVSQNGRLICTCLTDSLHTCIIRSAWVNKKLCCVLQACSPRWVSIDQFRIPGRSFGKCYISGRNLTGFEILQPCSMCVCVCVCVGACVGVVCACVCVWVCCPIHFSLLGFGNIRSLSSDAYCMAGTAAALYDDVRVTS